jgi:hypothetical protein
MSITSKSPRKVAAWAYGIGREVLADHAHRCAPRKFTQPQLFACLVLKTLGRTDYRGVVRWLHERPDLRRILGLSCVPHFTTLQKAAARLLSEPSARRILDQTTRHRHPMFNIAAIDSTGFERTQRSPHCSAVIARQRRRLEKTRGHTPPRRPFTKLGIVVDVADHFVHAMHVGRGPRPDVDELIDLVGQVQHLDGVHTLLADAGYDSAANHAYLRDQLNITSVIPARAGRPTTRAPVDAYRRLMHEQFPRHLYHQRAQVETVMSMIKRNLGHHTPGRADASRFADVRLKVLTHNLMILRRQGIGFLQGMSDTVSSPRRTRSLS